MALDRRLVNQVRRLDQYDLRRLMILARGLLLHADDLLAADESGTDAAGTGALVAGHRVTYRQEYVRCGKSGCTTCPHGPYWYGYWKQDGRTRSQYVGRHLPGQALEAVVPDPAAGPPRSDPDGDGSPPAGGGGRAGA